MTINRALIKDILSNLAVFSLPFSIVSVVYFIAHGVTEPFLLALVAPFLLMYAIRKRITKKFAFVALHVLVIFIAGLIIGDRDSRWFVWIFLVLTGLFSFYLKTREEINPERAFSAVLFIVHIALFLLLGFAQEHANPAPMQIQLVVTLLIAKAMCIIFIHMDNIDYRINVLSKINGFNDPNSKVISANNKLIITFVGIIAVVSIIVLFGTGLWRSILVFMAWFGRLWTRFSTTFWSTGTDWENVRHELTPTVEPHELDGYFLEAVGEFLEDVEQHDQEALFYAFHRGMDILAFILIPLLIGFLIWKFYKRFRDKRNKNSSDASGDTVIALESNVMNDLLELLPRFKNKYGHPVRRAYAKKVNKHIKTGTDILTADTTDIIANKIRTAEDIDELTAKYERVRYGK